MPTGRTPPPPMPAPRPGATGARPAPRPAAFPPPSPPSPPSPPTTAAPQATGTGWRPVPSQLAPPGAPGTPQWGQPWWTPPVPGYQDAGSLATWLVILVSSLLVFSALEIGFGWLVMGTLEQQLRDGMAGDVTPMAVVADLVGFLRLALFVAAAIVFGFWMARTHRNAFALTGQPLRHSTVWTVGSWYIPVVGGFLAVRPLVGVWQRAPGGSSAKALAWAITFSAQQVATVIVTIVAVAWGALSIFSLVASGGVGQEPSAGEVAGVVGDLIFVMLVAQTALAILYAVAGILMVASVRAIQAGQRALAARGAVRPPPAMAAPAPWARPQPPRP